MHPLTRYGPSVVVLVTAVLVLLLGPSVVQRLAFKRTQARMVEASHRLEESELLRELNQAYRDIATLVEPSVVHVSAEQPAQGLVRASVSSGSGWIYDAAGHVVTNFHVVRDAERIDVQLNSGENREATIVGADPLTDIAVLKIEPGLLHPSALRAVEDPVQQGDLIFAFGSPFDFRFSMSSGVVSGKGRYVGVIRDRFGAGYENFIQVDAAINPGNSGGPLTDYQGRVIGMNTAIATGRRSSLEEGQFAGIGLAIPLEMIVPAVEQIIEKGFVEKGYLGVGVEDLVGTRAQSLGFKGAGVHIWSIEPDGPADRAGLRVSDIVTAVNGMEIDSQPQLRSVISSIRPGETISLDVWRAARLIDDDGPRELSVTVILDRLDSLETRGELPQDQSREAIPELGIERMSTATPERARELGIAFHEGVILEALVPGSALADRVRPNALVVEVWGKAVTNVDGFIDELRKYRLHNGPFGGGVRVSVIEANGDHRVVVLNTG